jgi:3-oxoacyl-[acyl-carrier-protein] synthase III
MRQIEPIQIWKDGEQFEAIYLNATIVNDNLESACSFYYSLNAGGQGTEEMPIVMGQAVAEGNLTMSEKVYLAWDNSNEQAYEYIAEKLNLTLINE